MNLTKDDIYIGTSHRLTSWVFGGQFGPVFLAARCDDFDALNEWDERHGERVDPEDLGGDLADYPGETIEERIWAAVDAGAARVNDGGTVVWVDPCEWLRQFRTPREAGRFFRGEIL